MELVEKYVKKYSSANYQICADESLGDQLRALLAQCQVYNGKIDGKMFGKKLKKLKLSNEIALLVKVKEIAEEKEAKWQNERKQMRESIERVPESVVEIATGSSKEFENLKAEIDDVTERNNGLVELVERYELKAGSDKAHVISLESKISQMERMIAKLEGQLSEAKSQLFNKEQHILSLSSHNCRCEAANVCTVSSMDGGGAMDIVAVSGSPPTLTIQDRLELCKVLGQCNTSESPITLSNRFEAVVTQYRLSNRDAWSLLQAWLPGPLAAQLSLADIGDHCRGEELRRKELQRILGGRDTRGENALRKSRFRQQDDPILFCNNYLTLYRSVYNCPDMSQDDASFLYSMANRCNVDYTTRIALSNASSYERFINILRDWCEDSRDSYETSENISMVYRPRRRRYVRYCYRCGRTGHIKRFCNAPYIYPETEVHSLQQEIDSVQSEEEISTHLQEFTETCEETAKMEADPVTCEETANMEADPVIPAPESQTVQGPNIHKGETKKQQNPSCCKEQKEGVNIPVLEAISCVMHKGAYVGTNMDHTLYKSDTVSWSQVAEGKKKMNEWTEPI
ncbi:posterior protein-like [Dendropsophus ebraccatus]|uniref:posterior protein-like n=1 Tax=Dendropsophus ebraccatus TaxID=150705 RepID=UPI0038317984